MTKHFTSIASILLIVWYGFSSCQKDKDIQASTGSINGTINPAGAAKSIIAIPNSATGNTEAKLTGSNGFSIEGLAPGNYKIGFTAMPGFTAPDTVRVTIAAGKNADIGTVVFKIADLPAAYGSISGVISPAGAAAGISIMNLQSNKVYLAIADTTTGVFNMADIDTGSYKISFTGTAKFLGPSNLNTTVVAGQNKNLGTIAFQQASIMGIFSPPGSVNYVSVNAADGSPYGVVLDEATGVFKTGTLAPGDYYVSFTAAPGYGSLSKTLGKVTVAAGQTIDVGTIVMFPHVLTGAPFITPAFGASYTSPDFAITAGKNNIDFGSSKSFKITMDDITAPGTYQCKNTATSNITYTTKNSSYSPTLTWSTINTGGSGTVVVTSIDTVKKQITGTFKAILVNPQYANVVIDDGSFTFGYQ